MNSSLLVLRRPVRRPHVVAHAVAHVVVLAPLRDQLHLLHLGVIVAPEPGQEGKYVP